MIIERETTMNIDQLQENWDQVKDQAKAKFDKLTTDDLASIQGKKGNFIGKLKERYGYASDKAETELAAFIKNCQCSPQGKSGTAREKSPSGTRL